MDAEALVERIDRILFELQAIKADIAASMPASSSNGLDARDDLAPEHLIEVSTAVARFNRPPDSIRWMCRHRDCGVKRGGRWMVSAPRLERYLNGGG